MAAQKKLSKKSKMALIDETMEGYATSFDGTKIWFRSRGKGIPIILCNGLGCSIFYFHYLEEYFKQNYQVIVFDYRGHGKSEPPADPNNFTISSLRQDVKAVLDHLKIKKAILAGHSMGSQIIYDFHAHYPTYCHALIPCFGTYEEPMSNLLDNPASKYIFEGVYALNVLFPKLCGLLGKAIVKNPLRIHIGGLLRFMNISFVDKKIVEDYLDHLAEIDPVFFTKLSKDMQMHSVKDHLHKIKIPVLIIGAENDKLTPVWLSKKMHHYISSSELFVVKQGTHIALIEQPELINLRIEKFLRDYNLDKPKRIRKLKAKK